jgi:hypothetical protein
MSSTRISPKLDAFPDLASKMLFGSLSSTYRTCGKPDCVCHTGQRHGPYLHVSYREGGRTRGYYVPATLEAQVREGIEAWQRFQAAALKAAEHNRLALGLAPRRGRSAKEKAR